MRVPLWTKLGALFGGLYGLVAAGWGAWDWSTLVAEEEARRRAELETLAAVVAEAIDAEAHAGLVEESDRGRPAFRAVQATLGRVIADRAGVVDWAGTCTRDPRGRWRYVVDGATRNPFPVGYPIFDGIALRDRAFEGREVWVDALQDESGRWHTALAPIRGADGAVVGLVEIVSDADKVSLVLADRLRAAALQLAVAVGGGLLVSFLFGRLLSRDLAALVVAARSVAAGRLDVRVSVRSRDEIGVLARAFEEMVAGLREREFIRDTFGRFVNPEVVSRILEDRSHLRLGGETRRVTVLMSDLRGFTALSDELGPERMVALLNRYLGRMTEVVEAHQGTVAELLGDGIVVLFGAPIVRPDDAARAVRCAVAMHHALAAFNAAEGRRLQMGIGVDTGDVVAGNIGDERHMKYGVVGAAINVAARLESFTLGNQVLITENTLAAAGQGIETEPPIEFRAKGRREPLRAYAVRAAGDLRMPDDLQGARVDVDLPATLHRVDGKQVDPTAHGVTLLALEVDAVVLSGAVRLRDREGVRLAFTLDGALLEDLYGVVESAGEEEVLVRLGSMPAEARAALEAFVSERAGEATGPRIG